MSPDGRAILALLCPPSSSSLIFLIVIGTTVWIATVTVLQTLGALAGVIGVVVAYRTLRAAGGASHVAKLEEIAELVFEIGEYVDWGGDTRRITRAQRRLTLRLAQIPEILPAAVVIGSTPMKSGDEKSAKLVEYARDDVLEALREATKEHARARSRLVSRRPWRRLRRSLRRRRRRRAARRNRHAG
jgi:hypothetical protein